MSKKETYYCMDEGQGFDHRCVEFYDGKCGREKRCRFQMSETLNRHFTDKWAESVKEIEQGIKDDIAETLGLRSSKLKKEAEG